MNTLLLIGRFFFGGYFIYNGVNHFSAFGMMTPYAKMKGVPFPAIAQGVTGLMLLLGGLSIVFGLYPLVGIILLVAFLVPVSLMMHNLWKLEDPESRMADRMDFMRTWHWSEPFSHFGHTIALASEPGALELQPDK